MLKLLVALLLIWYFQVYLNDFLSYFCAMGLIKNDANVLRTIIY